MKTKTMRLLSLLLSAVLIFSLTACGDKPAPQASQETSLPEVTQSQPQTPLEMAGAWLLEHVQEPTISSTGGDWTVFGLVRSGLALPDGYLDGYYQRCASMVQEKGGVLHEKKHTEYSRVVIALAAMGKDPADVGGYNLLMPLADLEKTVFQGINGAAYALIALDSGSYPIPENGEAYVQATRDGYIAHILQAQSAQGGWAVAGDGTDADVTAMVLQALSKYMDRQEVADAVEQALTAISQLQHENGGFGDETQSCETAAQVVVALAELGISMEDERFVKNGNTVLSRLLQFQNADGGFAHFQGDESNLMATEQAFYALVAADRMEKGESSLYTMG